MKAIAETHNALIAAGLALLYAVVFFGDYFIEVYQPYVHERSVGQRLFWWLIWTVVSTNCLGASRGHALKP